MRLRLKGFKAVDRDVDLERLSIATAGNGRGKTALLDALRFVALNYVPAMGKRPADVAALMNGRDLSVQLTLDDGRTIRRALKSTGKGFSSEAEASWLEQAKPSEHDDAVRSLFGNEELAVAECLDVRELLAATANQRAARLQQLLDSGSDPQKQAGRCARFALLRLSGVDELRCPENLKDLWPLVPAGKLDILKSLAGMLKAKLTEAGVAGALGWANQEKRAADMELRQKRQAREELLPRIQELGQFPVEEAARLTADRDRVQRELGAVEERVFSAKAKRQAFDAAVAELDRALGARARARQEREKIAEKLAALPAWREELQNVEAELDAMPSPPSLDLSEVHDLAERARAEDNAASVPLPEIPSLVALEAKLDRATRAYNEAAESPWSEVSRRALAIDGMLAGAKLKAKAEVLAEIDAIRALATRHAQPLEGLAEQMRLYRGELDQAKAEVSTLTAQRDAALEKARKHRAEAERLRGAAKEIEQDRRAAHGKASDEHAGKRGALIARRDTLRADISRASEDDRRTADALSRAEEEAARADTRRNELGDTAPEIEAGNDALTGELADLTRQLEQVQNSAAAHRELERLVREIDDAGAKADVFSALEWALQKTRAEELAEAGGPLIAIMKRFLAAAGRPEVPFFDSKDASMGWRRGERSINVSALSGAEWVLYTAALTAAMLILRAAPVKLLLVEGDALDARNLAGLLRGIEAVADDLTGCLVATHQAVAEPGPWSVIDMADQQEAAAA